MPEGKPLGDIYDLLIDQEAARSMRATAIMRAIVHGKPRCACTKCILLYPVAEEQLLNVQGPMIVDLVYVREGKSSIVITIRLFPVALL